MVIEIKFLIKEVMQHKGYSINKLAQESTVSKSAISNIVNNNKIPTISTLCKLAVALDVKITDLVKY